MLYKDKAKIKELMKQQFSPCVGRCSTIYGDNTCKGCKRSYIEVDNWQSHQEIQQDTWLKFARLTPSIIAHCVFIQDFSKFERRFQKTSLLIPSFLGLPDKQKQFNIDDFSLSLDESSGTKIFNINNYFFVWLYLNRFGIRMGWKDLDLAGLIAANEVRMYNKIIIKRNFISFYDWWHEIDSYIYELLNIINKNEQ